MLLSRRQFLIGGAAALAATATHSRVWGAPPGAASRPVARVASPLDEILGESPPIRALRDAAREIVESLTAHRRPPPFLVMGESGVGKRLLVSAMHRAGSRSGAPFAFECVAAIPDDLLVHELFGFDRNAFPDARTSRPGLFQVAHGGTLLLKEPPPRPWWRRQIVDAIERGAIRRSPGAPLEPADVWVAVSCACVVDDPRDRTFREFFDPLVPRVLTVPPLRERGDDLLLLTDHFLAHHCRVYEQPARSLSPEAWAALGDYSWDGNVRMLDSIIERAVILSGDSTRIEKEDVTASGKPFPAVLQRRLRARTRRPRAPGQGGASHTTRATGARATHRESVDHG